MKRQTISADAVIIGAGAAGLMCAIRAGECGLRVAVVEKAPTAGNKIRISGGGRCNFTNLHITPSAYLSPNPHFCKSALSRYTQWDFIELLHKHGLTYHEKTLGQLFCEQKSTAIINMLLTEAQQHAVNFYNRQNIHSIDVENGLYRLMTDDYCLTADKLVVACGGPSIPKIGGSDFALRIARQFKVDNTPFAPALVPLTLPQRLLSQYKILAGVSHFVRVTCRDISFSEKLLFTHRGLSGPVILQISSYWRSGDTITIDLMPDDDAFDLLKRAKQENPKHSLSKVLRRYLPNKLATTWVAWFFADKPLQSYSDNALKEIADLLHHWQIIPGGSEGMKKAEVSRGGISPDALSSQTFACKQQKGLYFIGEAVDVIGWLGGYNFQWAWSSGWCCGDALAQ